MGLFLYLRRVIMSLREKGVIGTMQAAISFLLDWGFDLRYGTDTMRWRPLQGLAIRSENVDSGRGYVATKTRFLRRFFAEIPPPAGGVLVDFGCGKGRVLLVASRYPFRRIVGVEFSPELCAVARRNIEIYKRKAGIPYNLEIWEGDAARYPIQDDETVFFFFNPFDERVLAPVIANICKSLDQCPRKAWIIYHAPICREVLDRNPRFRQRAERQYAEARFVLYESV